MKRSHSSPLSFLFPWLSPLVISFAIVDGGIEVQLSQNNQLLKDWQPSRLRRVLPEPLIKWMEDQRIHIGPQPYPLIKQLIKQLWQSLAPRASKKLIFDPASLAELREGPKPQDFALVWKLNRSSERIEGHYEGADRYLGMGWFQKGINIWSLSNTPSVELDIYLKDLTYPVRHAAVLFESNIPYLQRYLPTRADFQIIIDFAPQVIVRNVSSNAVTLALQCNYPQLVPTIKLPQQKIDVLLADQAVIRFSQQVLTPVMTYLLQSGSAITLEGESIPLFIREQLPIMQRHGQISDDLAAKISQAHPIVLIPTLKPTSSLSHTSENGIGKYNIAATYTYQQQTVNIDTLLAAHQRTQRFVRQHGIWFEWPENSRSFVDTVLQQRANKLLRSEEVMGFDTQRTALMANPPAMHTIQPTGATPVERAQFVFKQLRQHGIPGGIVGDPPGLISMFVKACEDLVHNSRQARILWVVPSNKKGSVTRAVHALPISSYVTVASPVTLRDEPALFSHAWTLVIFQELDQLLAASSMPATFSRFLWAWALISISSRSTLNPSILRVLHLPEKYCEQFGVRYLFDPSKISTGVVAENRLTERERAQREFKKQEGTTVSPPSFSTPKVGQTTSTDRASLPGSPGSKYEAQQAKLLQHFEMMKQSPARFASLPIVSSPLSKSKLEKSAPSLDDTLPLKAVRSKDERVLDMNTARKVFLTVIGERVAVLNATQKVPQSVLLKHKPSYTSTIVSSSSEPKIETPASLSSAALPGAIGSKYQAQQEKLMQHFEMLRQSRAQHASSLDDLPATSGSGTTGGTSSSDSHNIAPKPASLPKRSSIELNQHTIVRLQQESEQLRERLTVEDEEDSRSLSSTIQQNVDTFGGSSDLLRAEAKPVPENAVPHEKVTVRPDIKQGQKNETALPAMHTATLSFWEQAREWRERSHGPVPLEKFKHYHPDYTLMNTSQLNWYFYWRSEVRAGRYPATDVGYIFIHAYEALACIGFTNPAQACDRLFLLWKHYRESFADLDKYLVPWIADFCVVHTVPLTPMQWYEQVLAVPDCDIDAPLIAEAWLRQGGDWTQIPTVVLYKLVGFNTRTNFYQKMRQRSPLDEGYKRAIAAVDNYLSSKFDRPALITWYGKGKLYAVDRVPFKWALVEQTYAPITVATINAAFTDAGFIQALSGILKYADHVQRKLYQNAVSPFVPTIDVNWQEVIEAALTNKTADQSKEAKGHTVSENALPATPSVSQRKDALIKPASQKTATTLNVDLSVTSGRQQSTSGSYIEERVAVLKQYWRHFDEIHARQEPGMKPLWGLVEDFRLFNFEHRYHFQEPYQHQLYLQLLPATILTKIDQVWGTTILSRWPEWIVSEPFPHALLAEVFGTALKFWHGCALTAWFICEGPSSRTTLGGMPAYYRKDVQKLKEMGTPTDERLFKELAEEEKYLNYSHRPGHRYEKRGTGFEKLRDIISSYRRKWADQYLDKYLRTRWETDLNEVTQFYKDSLKKKGYLSNPKQFAQAANAAANYWFGGDVSKVYEAMHEAPPIRPRPRLILPPDRVAFAFAVFKTLDTSEKKPNQAKSIHSVQLAPQTEKFMEDRYYQLSKLVSLGLSYVQLEEALGYAPSLKNLGTNKFARWSTILSPDIDRAWSLFVDAIEMAKRAFPASNDVHKSFKTEPKNTQKTLDLIQTSVKPGFEKTEAVPAKPDHPTELGSSIRVPITPPAVQLDTEAILRLRAESDQLQGRLTIEEEEDQAEHSPQIVSIAEEEPVAPVINNISVSELEVDEDWKGIAQQWQPEHWEVIRLLHQAPHAELTSVERQARRPLSRLIDEINSPVDELLGDLLIDPDTRTIADHLQETIETMLVWYLASREK